MGNESRTSLEVAFDEAQARRATARERNQASDLDPARRAREVDQIRDDVTRLAAHRAHGYSPIQETERFHCVICGSDDHSALGHPTKEDSETHVTDTPTIQTTTGHSENTPVNHPVHYNADPSGVECIQIIRHRNHNIGAAIKYLWRAGLKVLGTKSAREAEIQDLEKAVWYIQDEIARLKALP